MPEAIASPIQPTGGSAPLPTVSAPVSATDAGVASFVAAPQVPIHTIPDRFLPSKTATAPARNKRSKLGLAILIGVIWVVIIGIVLWMTIGKRFMNQPSSAEGTQVPVMQNQQQQETEQPQETSLVPPKTIESAVRNGSGKIISRATLLVPETEQGVSFTIVGKSIPDDASSSKKAGMYGEYMIRPVVSVATPLSLSISIPEEDSKDTDLRIATWNEEAGVWSILENSFFDAEKSHVTVLLSLISADSYGVVSEKAVNATVADAKKTNEEKPEENAVQPERSDDTDSDGLTDLEEFLYGTDPTVADTDKDSYRDGAEVLSLFSPRKQGEVRLAQDDKIAIYANPIHGYTLLYPGSWAAEPVDDQLQDEVIVATTTDEEYISVKVNQNLDNRSLLDWYQAQSGLSALSTMRIQAFQNLDVLVAPDGTSIFVKAAGVAKVVTFQYESGNKKKLNFLTTFEMIARGLRVEGAQKRNTQEVISRDTERITLVKKIQTALELYFTDNTSYPLSDASQGIPLAGDGKKPFSSYLAQFPQPPLPSDGVCGDANNFRYRALDSAGKECSTAGSCTAYEVSLCLGVGSGGIGPGPHLATPDGIK